MKQSVLFLAIALSFWNLVAQPATPFEVHRQDNLRLPWGIGGLSVLDGSLRGCSAGLMLVGETARAPLAASPDDTASAPFVARMAPDTLLARMAPNADFVVRNPADSLLYFTVVRKGVSRLYCHRDGKGTRRPVAVTPKGWRGGISHPAFSSDGKLMIFSAATDNGFGGYDLWCSCRNGDGWDRPVNLGTRINTKGDEMYPVFYGRYLVFASNGRATGAAADGLPATDSTFTLYATAIPSDHSADQMIFHPYAVQRLPEPLNSVADDQEVAFDMQHDVGYWLSSRRGREELYIFQGRLDGTRYSGQVLGAQGHPLAVATVTVFCGGRVVASAVTDTLGRYSLYLQPGADYTVQGRHGGHYMHTGILPTPVRTSDSLFAEVRYDMNLSPLPVGFPMSFSNLFGPAPDIDLTDQGRNMLMFVAQSLRENSTLRAELKLFSQVSDDTVFNDMLNKRRMNALREYFEFYLPATTRILYKNGNHEAVLPASENLRDMLNVIFIE